MSDDNQFEDDQVNFETPDNSDFDDFDSGGSSLGELWRNNPMVKIGVIAGVLITIIGAVVLFGGDRDQTQYSRTSGPSKIEDTSADGEVTDAMRRAIEERNLQRREEAERTGGSTIPTPINTPVTRLDLPNEEASIEDPLDRWRRIQEERQRAMRAEQPRLETADPSVEQIDALANAMLGQMEQIVTVASTITGPMRISITDDDWLDRQNKQAADAAAQAAGTVTPEEPQIANILIPAGSIEYAQLITEANSDAQAPVLAQLVSGPLSGSRMIGSFTVQNDFLVITFNSVVIDGIVHSTNALAIDPDKTTPAMVTDINRRYFTRVILPAAASFVEGMGKAIAEKGETKVVVTGDVAVQSQSKLGVEEQIFKGVEEAASKVSEILDEQASSTSALIRVRAGTPMGLLFLQPVVQNN